MGFVQSQCQVCTRLLGRFLYLYCQLFLRVWAVAVEGLDRGGLRLTV